MVLPMFDHTKHFLDTFEIKLVSPKEAQSRCHVLAYHYLKGGEKGESWILLGLYEHNLVLVADNKWVINKMKLVVDQ